VPTLTAYDAMDRRGDELGMAEISKSKNREVLASGRDAVKLGRVAQGCVADLLIVDGDPLTDPSVLWGGPQHRTVIQNGIVSP
jgi:hypothetical protein